MTAIRQDAAAVTADDNGVAAVLARPAVPASRAVPAVPASRAGPASPSVPVSPTDAASPAGLHVLGTADASQRAFRALEGWDAFPMILLAADTTVLWASKAVSGFGGYRPEELIGTSGADLVHPDDLVATMADLHWEVTAGAGLDERLDRDRPAVVRMRHADGHFLDCELSGVNRFGDPAIAAVLLVLRDVTPRRTLDRTLELISAGAPTPRVLHAVATLVETLLVSSHATVVTRRSHPDPAHPLTPVLGRALALVWATVPPHCAATSCDPVDLGPSGELQTWALAVRAPSTAEVLGCIVVGRDAAHGPLTANDVRELRQVGRVTSIALERARQESELRRAATTDALTGLANRTELRAHLGRLRRSHDAEVALLYLDLDDFKAINDTFGHTTGDDVLVEVARRLQRVVREGDLVARTGGDEFVVCVPCPSIGVGERLAQRVVDAMSAPFTIGSREMDLGGSVGVAVGPARDAASLVEHADQALYEAKLAGKRRWVCKAIPRGT